MKKLVPNRGNIAVQLAGDYRNYENLNIQQVNKRLSNYSI